MAVDPHKWLFAPVACGCALVAHDDGLRSAFNVMPEYIGGDGEMPWLSEFSIEQSRGFRALKLWLLLQQVGVSGYTTLIRGNVELNHFLQEQLLSRSEFRFRAAGPLSISCFLYDPGTLQDVELGNRRVLEEVQREGNVFLTGTRLKREFVLRTCIVNFRSTESDITALLDEIAAVGGRDASPSSLPKGP